MVTGFIGKSVASLGRILYMEYHLGIIALKASGRDCTNNNELLHKIGVL